MWKITDNTEVRSFIRDEAGKFCCQIYDDVKFNKDTQIFRAPVRNGKYLGSIEVVLGSNGQPLSTNVTLSS